jgi:hypoxanthine phosphoribosyltransferase
MRMVNTTYPEFAETRAPSLPVAETETLWRMRSEMCSATTSRDFKLQPQQRFLRRILGPDSSVQSLLMVHGTGTGKTCTAIQVAEEYVVRPEFQGKKVLVIANPSVQDNFKSQVFDVSKVNVDKDGLLLSQQCTGRRYLEILQRAQSYTLDVKTAESRNKIRKLAERILSEFYEFQGYMQFANYVDADRNGTSTSDYIQWIHDTFDNRLVIIDEAHNIRETLETTEGELDANKKFTLAIEDIVKHAKGMIFVLLTATPMFDKFDEIVYYFNLFLWNERKLDNSKTLSASEIFTDKGMFKPNQEERFRRWCQDYVSYVKGENPFTFPFRLPPPDENIAEIDRVTDASGKKTTEPRQYLTLTKSYVSTFQEKALKKLSKKLSTDLICVYPEYKTFPETFATSEGQYVYREGVDKFLAPSRVGVYSSKFALILKMLNSSKGVVFVYSNSVTDGTNLFAMCLEEHGYTNAIGNNLLKSTSGEVTKGSKGRYVLFTGETNQAEIKQAMVRLKARSNATGDDIRVIIASPKVSEGVDFKYVRQIHVLDPWWNMSRIEQVLGRGMRTCSHAELPPEEQNCTVYLHVCRYPGSKQETLDETVYRTFVERKAVQIARVKKVIMESAMDCDLESGINNLPKDWKELTVPQRRSQDERVLNLKLEEMSAPSFEDTITDLVCKLEESKEDKSHVRPLSAILDIRDEVFNKLITLFMKKPVWKLNDLYTHPILKQYAKNVLEYLFQNAIETGFQFKDGNGRLARLTSHNGVLSLMSNENDTLVEKLIEIPKGSVVELPKVPEKENGELIKLAETVDIVAKREAYDFPEGIREMFDEEILNWYIVDAVLTESERIQHLLYLDWEDPPIYAKDLRITMENGNHLYVLGAEKLYNNEKLPIVPIGDEKDAYTKWLTEQKNTFIERRNDIFASVENGTIAFNIENVPNEVKRASRTKSFKPRQCSSFNLGVLSPFVKWLSDEPFPKTITTKEKQCLYLELAFRRAVLAGKERIFWVAPQVLEIFLEDRTRKDILARMKD